MPELYDHEADRVFAPTPPVTHAANDLFALVGMILDSFPPEEAVRILKRTFPYREGRAA